MTAQIKLHKGAQWWKGGRATPMEIAAVDSRLWRDALEKRKELFDPGGCHDDYVRLTCEGGPNMGHTFRLYPPDESIELGGTLYVAVKPVPKPEEQKNRTIENKWRLVTNVTQDGS